jgi:hypothetical protein
MALAAASVKGPDRERGDPNERKTDAQRSQHARVSLNLA